MTDLEFKEIWEAAHHLNTKGAFAIVFRKDREQKIREGFKERYNDVPDQLMLQNIKFVFV
jgi:hypothetical protein